MALFLIIFESKGSIAEVYHSTILCTRIYRTLITTFVTAQKIIYQEQLEIYDIPVKSTATMKFNSNPPAK